MIIQRVIKGIGGIDRAGANATLANGITCRWWSRTNPLPRHEIPIRLTERNLDWHQNQYDEPDPLEGGEVFSFHTPFISTTAGSVERDAINRTNTLNPAWLEALRFATRFWQVDGYLFHCYVFLLGRPAVGLEAFAEEVRELHIYPGFSPFQPEGEITAKIVIPSAQIERAEFWSLADAWNAVASGALPAPNPAQVIFNPLFIPPEDYNNVRDVLG